ncbi:MAG: response regulator transcription factor [Lachnospiraceae bacterium]
MVDILIVEDNLELCGLLRDFLQADGYETVVADSGEKALDVYQKQGAKLIVLDIMLPGIDGFAVCKKIREQSDAPILIVSAKTEKDDQLNGLMLGADDYIEKPYDIDIMLAKIRGILKRRYAKEEILLDEELRVDKTSRTVWKNEIPLDLTVKEFELLVLLMENRGKVLQKEYLFQQIWGSDSFSEPQTLTVHIKRLRQKIEKDPKNPRRILTAWGVGYRYQ